MKAIDLQLTRLTIVSNALMASLTNYQTLKDETGEKEVEIAIDRLSKVIRFLTTMNLAFSHIGPDICPNCGHNLAD